jgi:hypothetical protein
MLDVLYIKLFVPVNFGNPPFRARLGNNKIPATLMPMPEAAVNKYHRSELRKHQVRCPRQCLVVESIAEAFAKEDFSDKDSRFCVLAPDRRHIKASGLFIMNVCSRHISSSCSSYDRKHYIFFCLLISFLLHNFLPHRGESPPCYNSTTCANNGHIPVTYTHNPVLWTCPCVEASAHFSYIAK